MKGGVTVDAITFFSGMLSTALIFAFFTSQKKMEPLEEVEGESKGREAELFCKSCRKTQYHYEIEPYLFECKHCGKETDLRIPGKGVVIHD